MFDVFDRPDSNASCPRRAKSTTATQSLMLLNSEFSLATAKAFAERLSNEAQTATAQIDLAYALMFSRRPDDAERGLGIKFLSQENREDALTHYCLALLNSNEAIYLD
jgi:hypothetical protein